MLSSLFARSRLPYLFLPLIVILMAVPYTLYGDSRADIGLYHQYALAFLQSHSLPVEYPPLSLVPFSFTLLPLPLDYASIFVALTALTFLLSCFVVSRIASPSTTRAYVIYLLLAGPFALFGRYDIYPSLLTFAAVLLASRHRFFFAYILLALATNLKLYPAVLFPLFLLYQWQSSSLALASLRARLRAGISPLAFVATIASVFALAAFFSPSSWSSSLHYALNRPVSIESTPASILWLLSPFAPLRLDYTFGSVNLDSVYSLPVTLLFDALFALLFLLILVRLAQGRLTLLSACLATLVCLIATNHFLSVQYFLWFLPLLAFQVGLRPTWIAILVLTLLIYPAFYALTNLVDAPAATPFLPAFLVLSAARNTLLLIATFRLLRPLVSSPPISLPQSPPFASSRA